MVYTIISILLWVGVTVAWARAFSDVYDVHKNKGEDDEKWK